MVGTIHLLSTTTEFNIKKLDYLLTLFGMSRNELLSILNENRKKLFTIEDITGDVIKLTVLKKIDEVFKKGLEFYLDFSPINLNKTSKVFFRKKSFHSELSIEDKRIVAFPPRFCCQWAFEINRN